jgi:hypothetical protein
MYKSDVAKFSVYCTGVRGGKRSAAALKEGRRTNSLYRINPDTTIIVNIFIEICKNGERQIIVITLAIIRK